MKNISKIIASFSLVMIFVMSCATKEDELQGSDIDTSTPVLNETDIWLRDNYTTPYNIAVYYKWDANKVDLNRYLYPPTTENIIDIMDAVKKIWIDPYTELGGEDFIKRIAPREVVLVGGVNRNPSGTVRLGIADSGNRISLFETDFVDLDERDDLIRFLGTVQHEYCHILNQTVAFNEEEFLRITPSGYTAQWANGSLAEANEQGFLTKYSRKSHTEDFAEIVQTMLSYNNEDYNAIIDAINSEEARENIRRKEAIVANYFQTEFDINIYELQQLVADSITDVLNN